MPEQQQTRRGFAQPKRPVQKQPEVVWEQGEDTVQELRAARASLLDWMNTSTEEWRKQHPDRYSFQETTSEQQQMWTSELDRIERLIKAALEKPTVIQLDTEVIAASVQDSDTAQGTRDLEDAGAMGY
jgi:hypothetical protein